MNLKKELISIVVIVLILTLMLGCFIYKPSIHTATVEELQEINGIGSILSERIESYLDFNPNAEINELIKIDGIGEIKLELIKRKYR